MQYIGIVYVCNKYNHILFYHSPWNWIWVVRINCILVFIILHLIMFDDILEQRQHTLCYIMFDLWGN